VPHLRTLLIKYANLNDNIFDDFKEEIHFFNMKSVISKDIEINKVVFSAEFSCAAVNCLSNLVFISTFYDDPFIKNQHNMTMYLWDNCYDELSRNFILKMRYKSLYYSYIMADLTKENEKFSRFMELLEPSCIDIFLTFIFLVLLSFVQPCSITEDQLSTYSSGIISMSYNYTKYNIFPLCIEKSRNYCISENFCSFFEKTGLNFIERLRSVDLFLLYLITIEHEGSILKGKIFTIFDK
jgi:hypothetical protein